MQQIIINLAIILSVCGFVGILFDRLNVPPLVGYLIAGFILVFFGLGLENLGNLSKPLAELGIILVLFLAGIEIHLELPKKKKKGIKEGKNENEMSIKDQWKEIFSRFFIGFISIHKRKYHIYSTWSDESFDEF